MPAAAEILFAEERQQENEAWPAGREEFSGKKH